MKHFLVLRLLDNLPCRAKRDGRRMRQYEGEDATPRRFLHTQAPPFISPLPEGGYSTVTFATHDSGVKGVARIE